MPALGLALQLTLQTGGQVEPQCGRGQRVQGLPQCLQILKLLLTNGADVEVLLEPGALAWFHHLVCVSRQFFVSGARHGVSSSQRGIFSSNPARARAMRDFTVPRLMSRTSAISS